MYKIIKINSLGCSAFVQLKILMVLGGGCGGNMLADDGSEQVCYNVH